MGFFHAVFLIKKKKNTNPSSQKTHSDTSQASQPMGCGNIVSDPKAPVRKHGAIRWMEPPKCSEYMVNMVNRNP